MIEQLIIHFFGFFESVYNILLNISNEDIGYISTFFLAICSAPLFIKTIKDGHCKGVSGAFIICWFLGDILGSYYVTVAEDLPLILNYYLNTIFSTTILFYKIRRG